MNNAVQKLLALIKANYVNGLVGVSRRRLVNCVQ
jgi:hypothetical protein